MLKHALTHPPLVAALAAAGHGSKVLIADGNFPFATVRPPGSDLVWLNIAPGLPTISDLLPLVLTAVNVEEAASMASPDGSPVAAHDAHRAQLGPDVPFSLLERFAFYDAIRSADVGLVIATGDERPCSNLLVTIGMR